MQAYTLLWVGAILESITASLRNRDYLALSRLDFSAREMDLFLSRIKIRFGSTSVDELTALEQRLG